MIFLKKIGALTSKTYAFQARPWETSLVKSIDQSDSLGCLISVETKDAKILRVLPRYASHLQLEWCSDKARIIHEANDKHRLASPSASNQKSRFQKLNSLNHQTIISKAILASFPQLDLVLGRQNDLSTLYNAKHSARLIGADVSAEFSNKLAKTFAFSYASTRKLSEIGIFKSVLFLGVNPRWETSIANLLFRFRLLSGRFRVKSIGNALDLTYACENLGTNLNFLHRSSIGKHLKNQYIDKNALFAFGDTLVQRCDAMSLQKYAAFSHHLSTFKSIFLSTGPNAVGLAHLAFCDWKEKNPTYFVGAESLNSFQLIQKHSFMCETSFVHKSIKKASYLQPMQTYLEKNADYIRYDGVVQKAYKALNFGESALKPLFGLLRFLKSKNFFSFGKKASKTKYLLSIYTCDAFQTLCTKEKHLKTKITCMKSFYGNFYNASFFWKTSPNLLQLMKLQNKIHWHFIMSV